ncbi:MAG: glycosyltransferase family 2 protein [Bernardetiaceae bacterium]
MPPLFSVIIPTYNRAERLQQTLKSVLQQQFGDYEVLVIDDGSTDHTQQMILDAFGHYPQLRYYHKCNEERSVARNYGIERAKGRFLVFFDSDDHMHPNHLSTLAQHIEKNPDHHFFATKFDMFDGQRRFGSTLAAMTTGSYTYHFLLKGGSLNALVCAERAHLKAKFRPEFNICEDWIFCLENLYYQPIYLIDAITVTVIDHSGRSMANNQAVIAAKLRAVEVLIQSLPFSVQEQELLRKHAWRFCAIHAYLDGRTTQALGFWKKSPHFLSLLKILVGKKRIERIRTYLS